MRLRKLLLASAASLLSFALAQPGVAAAVGKAGAIMDIDQAARLFGARPTAFAPDLSPNGDKIVYLASGPGAMTLVHILDVPTLIFSGRHDEVTPASTEAAHRLIPGSEYVVMEESSHMSQAEQPEETMALVRGFLSRAEAAAGA